MVTKHYTNGGSHMIQSLKSYDIDEVAGEHTSVVLNSKIYDYDLEKHDLSTMLAEKGISRSFHEGLYWLLQESGYTETINSDKECVRQMKAFLRKAYIQQHMEKVFSDKTIGRWLSGEGKPDYSSRSRNAVFEMMFALKVDQMHSIQFFQKYYYAQPFNFRNSNECVYFWCLNHQKAWSDVEFICRRVDELRQEMRNTTSFTNKTILIGKALEELDTEDEVATYIAANLNPEEVYFQTAKQVFSELLEEAKELAASTYDTLDKNEAFKIDSIGYGKQKHSVDFLLAVIFGTKEKVTFKNDCDMLIRENFPTKEQFSRCVKDDATNADILRKILILIMFFITYAENSDTSLDDFYSNANYQLEECGFPILYPANPYDRLFLTCIFNANCEFGPLEYFREIFNPD